MKTLPLLNEAQLRLYRGWHASRGSSHRAPLRSTFDPLDHVDALRDLVLIQKIDGDFLFRVVGSGVVTVWGREFTGRKLSEITSGPYRELLTSLFDEPLQSELPLYCHTDFCWPQGQKLSSHRLLLPYRLDARPEEVAFIVMCHALSYVTSRVLQPRVATDPGVDVIIRERINLGQDPDDFRATLREVRLPSAKEV